MKGIIILTAGVVIWQWRPRKTHWSVLTSRGWRAYELSVDELFCDLWQVKNYRDVWHELKLFAS